MARTWARSSLRDGMLGDQFSVSPDGRSLVYPTWSDSAQGRLHVVDIDTGIEQDHDFYGARTYTDLVPVFSPDSRSLLVERSRRSRLSPDDRATRWWSADLPGRAPPRQDRRSAEGVLSGRQSGPCGLSGRPHGMAVRRDQRHGQEDGPADRRGLATDLAASRPLRRASGSVNAGPGPRAGLGHGPGPLGLGTRRAEHSGLGGGGLGSQDDRFHGRSRGPASGRSRRQRACRCPSGDDRGRGARDPRPGTAKSRRHRSLALMRAAIDADPDAGRSPVAGGQYA